MNVFRVAADMLHVFAILMLLSRLLTSKNAQGALNLEFRSNRGGTTGAFSQVVQNRIGVSLKTQELYLLVYCTRYLDLFASNVQSWYDSILKIALLHGTTFIIWLLRHWPPTKQTYRSEQDEFPHWRYAVAPCAAFSFLLHGVVVQYSFSAVEMLGTFSWALESVALVPQIVVFRKYYRRQVESNFTGGSFLLFMGMHRACYAIFWSYRAITEPHYRHNILVYIFGVIQLVLTFGGLVWPLSATKLVPLCAQWKELCCFLCSGTVASTSHFQHYEYDPYHTKWTMCAGIVSFVAVLLMWAMLTTSLDPVMSSHRGYLLRIGYGLCFAMVFLIGRFVLFERPRRRRRVDLSMMVDDNDLLLEDTDIVLQAVRDKSDEDLLREPLLMV